MRFIIYLILVFLTVCGVYDYIKYEIPNYFTYPLLLIGIAYQIYQGEIIFLLAGLTVASTISISAYIGGAMGGGDVKLLIALGPILGFYDWSVTLVMACIFLVIWSFVKLYQQGKLKAWFLYQVLSTKDLFASIFSRLAGKGKRVKSKYPFDPKTDNIPIPFGPCIAASAWLLFFGANLNIFKI